MRAILATLVLCFFVVTPADTRGRYHHHNHHHYATRYVDRDFESYRGDPRPHAWCGWYMRHRLGVADRRYNRAIAWARWGYASSPQPGAVVVWSHHVGELISHVAGDVWVVLSGNDGHAVRERPRSIARAVAIRSGSGNEYASVKQTHSRRALYADAQVQIAPRDRFGAALQ